MSKMSDKSHKRRGRPQSTDKKHTRTLTLTDDAWEGLRNQASSQGISISELNEKLGRNEFAVISKAKKRLREVDIYQRICAYTERPSPGFLSLLAFVKNAILRLSPKQPTVEELEAQVVLILNNVIEVLFFTSYLYPDISAFRSLTSCTPWLAYALLLNYGFDFDQDKLSKKLTENILSALHVSKIYKTLENLEDSGVPIYTILKMRFLEGLSIAQMHRIIKLQEWKSSDSDVKDRIKQAFGMFREKCLHMKVGETFAQSFWDKNIDIARNNEEPVTETIGITPPVEAFEYSNLMSLQHWSVKERENVKDLLMRANNNSKVAFWLGELNSLMGKEDYPGQFDKIRKNVITDLDNRLSSSLSEIDEELFFCTSRRQIDNLLISFIEKKVNYAKLSVFKHAKFIEANSQPFEVMKAFESISLLQTVSNL